MPRDATIWTHKTHDSEVSASFYPADPNDNRDADHIVISDVRKGDTIICLTLTELREIAAAVEHHAEA